MSEPEGGPYVANPGLEAVSQNDNWAVVSTETNSWNRRRVRRVYLSPLTREDAIDLAASVNRPTAKTAA